MPEQPLSGIIPWEQHRQEIEAAWLQSHVPNPILKKKPKSEASAEPRT
jgi:hypothetical protein